MSRISEAFARGKAMISFLPVGDPSLARTREYMTELDRAGADIIGLVLPSFRCGTDPGDNEADAGSSSKMEEVLSLIHIFIIRFSIRWLLTRLIFPFARPPSPMS